MYVLYSCVELSSRVFIWVCLKNTVVLDGTPRSMGEYHFPHEQCHEWGWQINAPFSDQPKYIQISIL